MYRLKFADGTVLYDIILTDSRNWFSSTQFDRSVLREDNIAKVEVSGNESYVLLNQRNDFLYEYAEGYLFNLRDATQIELLQKEQQENSSIIGGTRADRRYEPGELITVDGKLFRVRLPILVGGFITPGTNVEETDIAAELSKLNLGGK